MGTEDIRIESRLRAADPLRRVPLATKSASADWVGSFALLRMTKRSSGMG